MDPSARRPSLLTLIHLFEVIFQGSFSRSLLRLLEGTGCHTHPRQAVPAVKDLLLSAGWVLAPVCLDPAQLNFLQGTLAMRLNNSVRSLSMQNTQLAGFQKEFGTASFWLLGLGRAGRAGKGLPFPLPKTAAFEGGDTTLVALRGALRLAGPLPSGRLLR